MGGPPKSILAISDLTLGTDRADVPIGNAQQSLAAAGSPARELAQHYPRAGADLEDHLPRLNPRSP
jgi:hypothetical protein